MMLLTLRTKLRDELWGTTKSGYRCLSSGIACSPNHRSTSLLVISSLAAAASTSADHLFVGIIAERGVGAGYAGIVEQVVPDIGAKFLDDGFFEQIVNHALHGETP